MNVGRQVGADGMQPIALSAKKNTFRDHSNIFSKSKLGEKTHFG